MPLIALKFALAGGASQDPSGKEGLATMVADLLTEGAGELSEEAFKAQVSALGMRLSLSAGRRCHLRRPRHAQQAICAIGRIVAAGADVATLRGGCDRAR